MEVNSVQKLDTERGHCGLKKSTPYICSGRNRSRVYPYFVFGADKRRRSPASGLSAIPTISGQKNAKVFSGAFNHRDTEWQLPRRRT